MLYTEKLLAELERQRDAFARYSARFGRQIEAYRAALNSLGERYPSAQSLEAALAARAPASSRQCCACASIRAELRQPRGGTFMGGMSAWRHHRRRGRQPTPAL